MSVPGIVRTDISLALMIEQTSVAVTHGRDGNGLRLIGSLTT
jgi:hypothetical protein